MSEHTSDTQPDTQPENRNASQPANQTPDGDLLAPAYTTRFAADPFPALRMPEEMSAPDAAYRYVHDELMLDGSTRQNLATFVTTWMEPEAEKLMAETFDRNAIDHDEYPSVSAIEQRCVSMVADLFHAPGLDPADPASATGVSTIGSSEAVMLAGLALKWRWRARLGDAAKGRTPKLVMSAGVQVVWEKFCRYFDVEPVYLPVREDSCTVTPEQVAAAVDEDTIGAVAVLGVTYTGEYEDAAGICAALDRLAADGGPDVPVHVDAASGGFVAPFVDPDLEWDFRLPRVVSINVSGHKYGLTYPGIGFALWRSRDHLPEELVFHVSYLGGDMPTFTLNFSRPGNQIVGQYYTFLRLGREGYTRVMTTLRRTALWLSAELGAIDGLRVLTDGSALPVLTLVADAAGAVPAGTGAEAPLDVYALSHELRSRGWQVPAYPMPDGAENVHVLRIVLREGMSPDLARVLRDDVTAAVTTLRTGRHQKTSFAH